MTDIESVYATERDLLIGQLRGLTDTQWATPSLCDGWSVRDVTAHLLMPYELSFPRFGPTVVGPAAVLASALMGRSGSAARLEGGGADEFRSRL